MILLSRQRRETCLKWSEWRLKTHLKRRINCEKLVGGVVKTTSFAFKEILK